MQTLYTDAVLKYYTNDFLFLKTDINNVNRFYSENVLWWIFCQNPGILEKLYGCISVQYLCYCDNQRAVLQLSSADLWIQLEQWNVSQLNLKLCLNHLQAVS